MRAEDKRNPADIGERLRVLCLEDSPADAELVREMLVDAAIPVDMNVATDRPGYEKLLADGPYDVILADFALPGFDARGALELAQAACPTTPFICVSGSIGEETTVELLKKGADDVVLKDRLARLPFAVRRAIEERASEVELAEERDALKQSESRFAALFEQAPLGYQSLDEDGSFLAVNEMWLQTLGYSREEVIGRWFGDFLAPEFVEGFRERFPKFKARGVIHSEFEMMHKDGSRRTIAFEGRIGHNPDGSFQKTHCILSDITERKRAAEALRESEEKFKFLWDCSVVAKSLTLPTGEADMNDAFCEMLGYTREELADKATWQQLTHPDDLAETQLQVDALLSGERESARYEKRYLHKDGHVIWADLSTSLRRDAAGDPMYFMTTIVDISDRKRLELELHHRLMALTQPPSEGKRLEFSDVFDLEQIQIIQDAFSDATGVASLLVDLEGRPISEPSNFRRLCGDIIRGTEMGLARCQASDVGLAKFNESGPTVLPCLSCGLWDASASISVGGEHVANWLIGQVRNEQQSEAAMATYAAEIGADVDDFMAAFAEVPTMPIEQFEKVARSLFTLAQQISIIAYQNVQQARFITEREATRRDLAHKEAMLSVAQATAHVGSWVWHVQTDRLEWSDEMYRIFDINKADFTGELADVIERAIHPDDRAAVDESNRSVAIDGKPQPLEYRIVRADGSIRVVYAEAGRLERDTEGNPLQLTGIVADITDRKQAENALRERTEELERSNEELQRFAYVASHDLREPLRMVTSYTQLLKKRYAGQLDADADDFIGYAVDGAARMEALIQDLLEYSHVGSQGREFRQADLDLVLDGVLKGLEVAIAEGDVEVTRDKMPVVNCDASQVGQVFQNLIANAIKFRRDEPMRIHLGVERSGREWVFSVSDNGLGIDAEYFDRVFVIFQRLQPRDDFEGSGMGLAICKRIVERHHGRIWVESTLGEGSTFLFTLRA